MGYLLTVMAHELAHIHHSKLNNTITGLIVKQPRININTLISVNHGPKFQKLNLQLRKEIQQLQQKGYYGPGGLCLLCIRAKLC
jgi:hypothetical protein